MVLVASVVALFIGPALVSLLGDNRRLEEFLDGFVLVAIAGLVLFHLLPDSIALGGSWAIAAAIVGFFIPMLAEHAVLGFGSGGDRSKLILNLALAGLALHAFLDGIALTSEAYDVIHAGHDHDNSALDLLSMGVLLHRLPVGLAIWSIVRPGRGARVALALLGMISLFTVAGHSMGPESVLAMPMAMFGIFEALVAGSLVHVVFHRPGSSHPVEDGRLKVAACLGAMAALALLGADFGGHGHEESHGQWGVADTFLMLALESAPALVLAFCAGGLLKVMMPMDAVRWLRRGGHTGQALKGMLFGLPLPICSCGVVPLYQSLTKRGVPPAAALAFLVATPELGVDALLVSLPLLGAEMTIARLICAAVVAVFVALAVSRWMHTEHEDAEGVASDADSGSTTSRVTTGLKYGFEDLVDDTMPWILAGLAIAAMADPLLDAEWLRQLPSGIEIPLFALLGMPVYVCAAGATPIVAVLLMNGVSPGAGIAFLLTGPATNFTTYGVLSDLHGRRPALLFGLAVAVGAIGVGFATDSYFGGDLTSPLAEGHMHQNTLLQQLALGVLALAFAWSVLRQGPREQFAKILPAGAADSHEGHDHSTPATEAETSCCGGS